MLTLTIETERCCVQKPSWTRVALFMACTLVWLLTSVPLAFADHEFFPLVGGTGGAADKDRCATGQYVVGAQYRSGSLLDNIAIICAPVDPNEGTTGTPQTSAKRFGGSGGSPNQQTCQFGYVVSGAGILRLSLPEGTYVKMMDFRCQSTTTGLGYLLANIGSPATVFPDVYHGCAPGEAVVGINVQHGSYVDAIGMICDKLPTVAPPPPSKPEPTPAVCQGLEGNPVPEEWRSMLSAHNDRRHQHCVAPLTWSNDLAQAAQTYADKCILNMHGADGENMADAWRVQNESPVLPAMTDKEAFERTWYCEFNNYHFDNPQFKGGFTANCRDVNGHFTEVVWKDTCQLGCGRATCGMTDEHGVVHQGTHWVCRFNPPGNKNVSDPANLKKEVLPATCP
jgi:Cysteine-rich secretory protein family